MLELKVTYDVFAGSSGKGLLNSYLSKDMDIVACNNGVQSGHTTYLGDRKVVTQCLPMGFVTNPNAVIMIGAGALIDPQTFFKELKECKDIIGKRAVFIDKMAMTVEKRHKEKEREVLKHGSTFKGAGACVADRALRLAVPFKEYVSEELGFTLEDDKTTTIHGVRVVFCDIADLLADFYESAYSYKVLLETAQGVMLDNIRGEYPFCTSRQCNPVYAMSELGITPWCVDRLTTIGVLRPYPIRINNNGVDGKEHYTGNSGNGAEITWEEVAKRAGYPDGVDIAEYTTVTKKMRRVFEFDFEWLKYVAKIYKPNYWCLNFANYLDYEMAKDPHKITKKVYDFINKIEDETGITVRYVSATPYPEDYIDRFPCYTN